MIDTDHVLTFFFAPGLNFYRDGLSMCHFPWHSSMHLLIQSKDPGFADSHMGAFKA
jgi:hypothetical protein